MNNRLLMALAMVLAVGCSRGELNDGSDLEGYIPDSTPMAFTAQYDSDDSAQSRGSLTTSFGVGDNIGVYGYYTPEGGAAATTPNFMNNQLMTKVEDKASLLGYKWDYSPLKFWSNNPMDTFLFQAYSPYESTESGVVASSIDGALSIDYTVPQNCALQPDLMIARPVYQTSRLSEGVDFDFYHALASISFKVVGDPSLRVSAISISGVKNKGVLTWDTTAQEPMWSGVESTDLTIAYSATIDPNVVPDEDESTMLTTSEGYLMMIPQEIPDEGFTVNVTAAIGSTVVDDEFQIVPTHVSKWEVNGSYSYVINLVHN